MVHRTNEVFCSLGFGDSHYIPRANPAMYAYLLSLDMVVTTESNIIRSEKNLGKKKPPRGGSFYKS